MNPDAILAADLHIRADTPQCRTDDFTAAMWKKLQFINDLANEHNIPILIAGDLGHRSQWPNWLLEKFMSIISDIEIIAIAGQHDLPGHNLEAIPQSGFGVLKRAGYILSFSKIIPHIDFFPFGTGIEKSIYNKNKLIIAMTHQMVIEDKPYWPGQVASSAKLLLKKFPDYKLILSGDNHQPFVVEYEGRLLVNPGSMMRTTADQIDHRPRVYLWEAKSNSVEAVYLPIEQGVIDRSHIDTKKEKDARIEAYTTRLSERYEVGLSYEENLKAYFDENRTRQPIKDRIWEACEI
jgi:DNA repair exonuclease SbcCD nuclease subunit